MNAPMDMQTVEQNPDIRYLGRLLGDAIRVHDGDVLFDRIETIRSASVDRHRGLAGQQRSGQRAGSAQPRRHARLRPRLHALLAARQSRRGPAGRAPPIPARTLAEALAKLRAEGVDESAIADLLDTALIAPVLTAHPTEVRRKSMIDHRNRIAELMQAARCRARPRPRKATMVEAAIRRQIALLWQTRPLRRERLYVADEVENALSYLREVFLPVLPGLLRALGARARLSADELPPHRQLDRRRPRRQSQRHRRLAAARARPRLPRRCSAIISTRCTRSAPNCPSRRSSPTVTPEVLRACRGRPATTRRPGATSPTAARSAASTPGWRRPMTSITGRAPPRPPSIAGRALSRTAGLRRRSCSSPGSAGGNGERRPRFAASSARSRRSDSISRPSTSGRMPRSTSGWSPNCSNAPRGVRIMRRFAKPDASSLLRRELASARLLANPFADLFGRDAVASWRSSARPPRPIATTAQAASRPM